MDHQSSCAEFIRRLREETRIYSNFPGIIEKVERDGHLASIFSTISNIFLSEMDFAITRMFIRAQTHEDQKYANRHKKTARDEFIYFQGESEADIDRLA
jgi:hypothetical protein